MGNKESSMNKGIMIGQGGGSRGSSYKRRSRTFSRKFANMHSQKSNGNSGTNDNKSNRSFRSNKSKSINGSPHDSSSNLDDISQNHSNRFESARRCELMLFSTTSVDETEPPDFSLEQKALVVRSWTLVDEHINQIGLSSYLELFRRAPESLTVFPMLKHLSQEDLEFYTQLRNHSVRVTGVLSMIIRQIEQDPIKADHSMKEFLCDLGRRHFGYGANTSHMELLGRVFVESLQPVFAEDPEKEAIQAAWIAFFRVIVFWLQNGFRFVQNKGNPAAMIQ